MDTGSSVNTVSMVSLIIVSVQLIVMLLTIIPTERALKKNFDEHGNRR